MSTKVLNFISSQVSQIREGNISVLLRKLKYLTFVILSIPAALVVRIIKPIIFIRFCFFPSQRMGAFIMLEIHLCELKAGLHGKRIFDVYFHDDENSVGNQQLKKMYERNYFFWSFGRYIARAIKLIPGGKAHALALMEEKDLYDVVSSLKPNISFTPEEEKFGEGVTL